MRHRVSKHDPSVEITVDSLRALRFTVEAIETGFRLNAEAFDSSVWLRVIEVTGWLSF